MCGIAGLALRPGHAPDPAVLEAMTRALAHRGPDGQGRHVSGSVGLAHTRLAIVDLAGGDQPFFAGPAAMVAVGEIYNDPELRASGSFACATGSDCEPPLHLWRRDGLGFADALRGMWSIALHDRSARRVVLSRDPFGIKPLYLAEVAGGLAFASEPQALLASGLVAPRVRTAARDELLQLQFTTGTETILAGIHRLLPGETLAIADGVVVERRRRPALPEGGPEEIGEAAALERFGRAFTASVEMHQRADVPYGMFLSGGTDSAAVLAAMARVNPSPVLAFTAGFDTAGHGTDEREQAAAAAAAAGARHVRVEVGEREMWRHLPEIVGAMDDPAADYAIVPTWFLARRARQEVKVVLSGEGGDEMLAGYGRHRSAMRPWWLGGKAMRAHGAFDRLDVLREPPRLWRDGFAATEAAVAGEGRSRLMAAQALDMADWLPNDLLLKLDRCLMAHGVEGRVPFLDAGVAEACWHLPDALKVRGDAGKWLLRRWLEREFPASRPFDRKKGFTVPMGAWIARAADRLAPLVAAQPGVAEIARPDRVLPLFHAAAGKREGFAAWHLLFYALWHARHVEGRPFAGDTFAVLAGR